MVCECSSRCLLSAGTRLLANILRRLKPKRKRPVLWDAPKFPRYVRTPATFLVHSSRIARRTRLGGEVFALTPPDPWRDGAPGQMTSQHEIVFRCESRESLQNTRGWRT